MKNLLLLALGSLVSFSANAAVIFSQPPGSGGGPVASSYAFLNRLTRRR